MCLWKCRFWNYHTWKMSILPPQIIKNAPTKGFLFFSFFFLSWKLSHQHFLYFSCLGGTPCFFDIGSELFLVGSYRTKSKGRGCNNYTPLTTSNQSTLISKWRFFAFFIIWKVMRNHPEKRGRLHSEGFRHLIPIKNI